MSRVKRVMLVAESAALLLMLTVLCSQPRLTGVSTVALVLGMSVGLVMLLITATFSRSTVREFERQRLQLDDRRQVSQQIEELFVMTDMLHAADDHQDAGAVLMSTSERLLPETGGALYIFNNSRDRLDLAISWNRGESFDPAETLQPASCWALKRGKPHLNDPASHTLCCAHPYGAYAAIEVPMIARGKVCGLLLLAANAPGRAEMLRDHRRLARALADSMSLALSNIALREQLRTLSLRDPLTGLYNRRYMEDALERYVDLGERGGTSTAVVMVDLDNFKRLNDEHGHAKGDAVLRDVAAQMVGSLRPADIIARYGGEELLVILPNCGLDDARGKAELLRARIAALSEAHGVEVSASLGVAAVPETSAGLIDVVPMADHALYLAKEAGKNCVRTAERRPERTEQQPRLVAS